MAFAPAFGHRGQGRRATKNHVGRIGPNALQEGELGIEIYVETGGNLKERILENLSSVAAAPAHCVHIAGLQQVRNLRTKELNHGTNPSIKYPRGLLLRDFKPIQHLNDVTRWVPRLPSDPSIGREQSDWFAAKIDGDCDQLAYLVSCAALEGGCLRGQGWYVGNRKLGKEEGRDPDRHTLGTQKGVEVTPLGGCLPFTRMRVEEELGVAVRVVDFPLGIMLPFGDSRRL